MNQETIDIDINKDIFEQLNQLKKQFGELNGKVSAIESTSKKSFSSISNHLKSISFVSFTQGLQNLNQGLSDISKPGMDFSSSMADMSAITGLTGKQLDTLGEKAKANAKEFGGSAAQSVETYKLLLSQLTPELAKQPKVLDAMARNVSILSKTMGGNTLAATEVLTTAMNQYGISMDNPIQAQKEMNNMMNIMAAAAKEGSSELPTIKQALENVGGQAKLSGLSFAELNSAIQQLDKSGKKGAEGGTALRTILTTLGKGRFLPKETAKELAEAGVNLSALSDKNVSFTQKMRMLQPVLAKDSELISTLFGEYGQAASALIQTADAQDKMTRAITGTNTAQQQADIVMESSAEKLKRMQASIDNAKISMFEATNGTIAYLEPISQLAITVSSFAPLVSGSVKQISKWKDALSNSVTPTKQLSTVTNQAGEAIAKTSTVTSKASSLMRGFGSVLTGIGWGAIAAGIGLVAARIYEVASGTQDAQDKLAAFQKGTAKGQKQVEKEISPYTKGLNQALEKNQNSYTSGEITLSKKLEEDQAIYKQSLQALNDFKRAYAEKRKSINDELQVQKEMQKWVEENYSLGQFGRKLVGSGSEAEKTNKLVSELASVDTKLKYLSTTIEEKNTELNRVNAEKKSGYKNTSLIGTGSTPEFSSSNSGIKKIDVRIQNLVKEVHVHTTNLKEGLGQIKQQVTEALVSSVRNFEIAQ
jgi:TP901 family phage tail tape measure protein